MKKKKPVIMIALDTSTSDTGYSVWKNGNLIEYDNICPDPKKKLPSAIRRQKMTMEIKALLLKYKPDIISIEFTSVLKNAKTQRSLDRLLGIIECYAWENNVDYYEYPPTQWRKSVQGDTVIPSGRDEKKKWDIQRVKDIFGIDTDNDNTADGILIGYAHLCRFD